MKKAVILLLLCCPFLAAQDLQNRSIVHVQADINPHWFVPAWYITNLRTQTPNNTNLLGGVGYRGKGWWLESMVQRQWNPKGNQVMIDFRYDQQVSRWHLYVEGAPFLTKKAFYEFVILERRTWKGFTIGAETENTHQAGPDTVALGPRAGHKLGKLAGFDVSATVAARFNPIMQPSTISGHPRELRLYLVFNRRLFLSHK